MGPHISVMELLFQFQGRTFPWHFWVHHFPFICHFLSLLMCVSWAPVFMVWCSLFWIPNFLLRIPLWGHSCHHASGVRDWAILSRPSVVAPIMAAPLALGECLGGCYAIGWAAPMRVAFCLASGVRPGAPMPSGDAVTSSCSASGPRRSLVWHAAHKGVAMDVSLHWTAATRPRPWRHLPSPITLA